MEHSGESMEYMDPITNEKYVPYCIEPSLGADRVALAFLVEAYDEEELEVHRTVSHMTSIQQKITRLQSVTEIQWNSRELRLTNLKSSWKEN